MMKLLKVAGTMTVLAMLVVFSTNVVFAGGDGNVYGLVFIDSNMNGVWDQGEQGYSGEWTQYWEGDEYIERYIGATITLSGDDGATAFTLESAGYREPNEDEVAVCTYQDFVVSDGDDEDEDPDINSSPVRPCAGTWGMIGGENGTVWKVWVTAPEGYVVTSANPQVYVAGSGEPALDFGIAPIGAGGVTTTNAVTTSESVNGIALPVTGGVLLGLPAIALVAVGGVAVVVRAKRRK
jgi:hypothetical protein